MKAKFWEVNYDERAFITLKEKKKIDDSMTLFPEGYYRKNMNIFNEKLNKWLVFVVIRQNISSFR